MNPEKEANRRYQSRFLSASQLRLMNCIWTLSEMGQRPTVSAIRKLFDPTGLYHRNYVMHLLAGVIKKRMVWKEMIDVPGYRQVPVYRPVRKRMDEACRHIFELARMYDVQLPAVVRLVSAEVLDRERNDACADAEEERGNLHRR